jgi:hypothetical protein
MKVNAKLLLGALGVLLLFSGICDKSNPVDPIDPDPKPSFGTFLVTLVAPQGGSDGYVTVFGRVNDGPTPVGIIWSKKASEGIFRLLTPEVPNCDEPCGGNALCVEGDTCQPYPDPVYVGMVTVNGIKTSDAGSTFTMDTSLGAYDRSSNLAYPPFNEGDDVSVSASGNKPFALTVKGISTLEIENDSIVLEDGKPVTLKWTPAKSADNSTLSITVDISHHGGTAGIIEGECPDNGSVTIPASLITQLKALGYFGFPKIEFIRKSVARDSATGIELIIESRATKYVHIPGLRSCNEDTDCLPGEICEYFRCKDTTGTK